MTTEKISILHKMKSAVEKIVTGHTFEENQSRYISYIIEDSPYTHYRSHESLINDVPKRYRTFDFYAKIVKACPAAVLRLPLDTIPEALYFIAIHSDPSLFFFIANHNPSPGLCAFAVSKDGLNLKYIKEQTLELCKLAVQNNLDAIQYVRQEFKNELILYAEEEKKKTIEEDMARVTRDGMQLQYVKYQTPEICMEAVKHDGRALEYVKDQTPELCMAAVKQNGLALQFVTNQTPEICIAAIKEDWRALEYVKDQTPEICLEAVKWNGYALEYVKDPKLKEKISSYLSEISKETNKQDFKKAKSFDELIERVRASSGDGQKDSKTNNQEKKSSNPGAHGEGPGD